MATGRKRQGRIATRGTQREGDFRQRTARIGKQRFDLHPRHHFILPGCSSNPGTSVTQSDIERRDKRKEIERGREREKKRGRMKEEKCKNPLGEFDSASHDIYIYFWPRSAVVARH